MERRDTRPFGTYSTSVCTTIRSYCLILAGARILRDFVWRDVKMSVDQTRQALMHKMEEINRRTWSNPLERRYYRKSAGYINAGEMKVTGLGLVNGAKGRILDLGVGGGRTTAILAPLARDYVGIDYTPEMVALARTNHPQYHFETMDARDLSAFQDNAFDMAVFSYNGLDSVDPEGRAKVLGEVARVLKPGAGFAFSTFNRNWRGFGRDRAGAGIAWTADPLRLAFRLARHAHGLARRRRRLRYEQGGEHAVLLHPAHNYGIMVYATTPAQLRDQLGAAGFERQPLLYSVDGHALTSDDLPDVEHFHVFATKRGDVHAAGR